MASKRINTFYLYIIFPVFTGILVSIVGIYISRWIDKPNDKHPSTVSSPGISPNIPTTLTTNGSLPKDTLEIPTKTAPKRAHHSTDNSTTIIGGTLNIQGDYMPGGEKTIINE